jgi:periodic tryptophan protein 2
MNNLLFTFHSKIGRAWAACTTEGLLIYAIDNTAIFDPIDLNETITPLSIRQTLYDKNDSYMALLMALKLNEKSLVTEIIENIDSSKGRHQCSKSSSLV